MWWIWKLLNQNRICVVCLFSFKIFIFPIYVIDYKSDYYTLFYIRRRYIGSILTPLSPLVLKINFVSVYDISRPNLCKSFTITPDSVFLYTFNDKSTYDNDGQLLGIRDSMSSQILETFVAFGSDSFTIPFSLQDDVGFTIHAIRLYKLSLC